MNFQQATLSHLDIAQFDAVILGVATIALLTGMGLILIRLFLGPSVYDRALSLNMFGTKTVLFLAILGFLNGRPDFLDIALLYALINFITTIAILKYFRYRDLSGTATPEEAPQKQEAP